MVTAYWYNLYSFWTAIMCILSYFKVIPFSVIPSVVATIFGTLVFLYMKLRVGKQMGLVLIALQIVLHLFPFLILPVQFTRQDILANIGVFVLFNLWLWAQGLTFMSVYQDIVYEDGRLTLYDYAARRGFL
jgi:hypothetical protein